MSSNTLTWDDSTPHRPGLNDVGGATKENAGDAPDPVRMVTAEDFNQLSKQSVAQGKMTCLLRGLLKFTAGAPSIDTFTTPGSNLLIGNITVTDNGTGDTTIQVAANKLPGFSYALLTVAEDVAIDRVRYLFVDSRTIRIKTFLGASATDVNIAFAIY